MARYIFVGPNGGNWIWFTKNQVFLGEFIKSHQISPANIGVIGERMAATAGKIPIDLGIAGGIRLAHVHFEDKIYMLNKAQWAELSRGIVADFKTRLESVRTIDFDTTIMLGNLTNMM